MRIFTLPGLRWLFEISCFLALFSMVSYWLYKYVIEDKDLCLVDYKYIENADEFLLPVVSVCLGNPFLDNKLKAIGPEMNSSIYLKYLQGKVLDDKFKDIDYNNVTVNLSDYLLKTDITWRNGSVSQNASITDILKPLYVTFSGMWASFYKCFGIEINEKYQNNIKYVWTTYKQNEFFDGLNRSSGHAFIVFFHYPNQFLFSRENYYGFFTDRAERKYYTLNLEVKSLEILKKRNKRSGRCISEFKDFDGSMLKHSVERIGCRAPYHRRFENFPICSTKTK